MSSSFDLFVGISDINKVFYYLFWFDRKVNIIL